MFYETDTFFWILYIYFDKILLNISYLMSSHINVYT